MPMLVSAGSISTRPRRRGRVRGRAPARSLYSATRVVVVGSTGAPTLPSRLTWWPCSSTDQRLVDRAVVAVAVDQDLRTAGDRAGQPDRPAVGVGGGEREAPQRHAEAAGQLARRPTAASLGRQHRGEAASPAARRDRRDDRRRRVAGHGAGVAEREVDVVVAVDVGARSRRAPRPGRAGSRRRSCSSRSSARRRTGGRGAAYAGAERGCASAKAARSRSSRRAGGCGRSSRPSWPHSTRPVRAHGRRHTCPGAPVHAASRRRVPAASELRGSVRHRALAALTSSPAGRARQRCDCVPRAGRQNRCPSACVQAAAGDPDALLGDHRHLGRDAPCSAQLRAHRLARRGRPGSPPPRRRSPARGGRRCWSGPTAAPESCGTAAARVLPPAGSDRRARCATGSRSSRSSARGPSCSARGRRRRGTSDRSACRGAPCRGCRA